MLVVGDLIADEFIYGEVAPRLARGAGADPQVRRDRDRRRRRRQRRQQRGGARRPRARSPAWSAPMPRAAGCWPASIAASIARQVVRAQRLSDAGQDAHPRRRHSLGQAAGRAHRSRTGLAARRGRQPRVRARSSAARARRLRRGAAVRLRLGPGHARARARRSAAVAARPRAAADSGARRLALPPARLSRPDGLHAERIGSRAGARRSTSTTIADVLEQAGRTLLRRTRMQAVLITRGSRGMALVRAEAGRPMHIPIFGSDEVADVTGAGDTVIATFGLALAAGASFYEAARLANYAGGLVVMKRGTATVSARELRDAVDSDHDTSLENWSQEGPAQGRRRSSRPSQRYRSDAGQHRLEAELVDRRRARSRGRADDRVRQRLLRPAARRPRALSRRARRPKPIGSIVAVNDDRVGRGAEGAGPSDPAGRRSRRARRRAARRRLRRRLRRSDGRAAADDCCKPDVHCKGTDYTVDTVPERARRRAPTAAAPRSSAIRRITRRAICCAHDVADRRDGRLAGPARRRQ